MASVSRETMEKSTSKPIGGHSTFLNGYPLAGSYRFGQIQPHFVQEVVPDDDIELSSAYKLDSYTLSQPLMQDLFISHGYYFIPYPALLPLNYEKFITNPNIGEDINASEVGLSYDFTSLDTFFDNLYSRVVYYLDDNTQEYYSPSDGFTWLLRYIVCYDMIFGLGSLPASLGYKFIDKDSNSRIDYLLQLIRNALTTYSVGLQFTSGGISDKPSDLHSIIELMRDDLSLSVELTGTDANIDNFVIDVYGLFTQSSTTLIIPSVVNSEKRVNISRILAYQLLCYHFFSNDKVDYIYSAELYRQNVYSCWLNGSYASANGDDAFFNLNGERYQYDYLSAYRFMFEDYTSTFTSTVNSRVLADCEYLRLLFGFNNSLRHVDYFTGARTRPLAVGNVGVQVNNNIVDVVDTIQTTWFAKFLNQVNRTGRRLSNYVKGLFPSTSISQDWHEPIWLGDVTDKIGSSEVDNTGVAQQSNKNSITSTLNSNANKYGFRYHNTQYYGVIIGVTYFDIERFYPEVCERPIFHVDRFDLFNPFLQFNGDQEVYQDELYGSLFGSSDSFGYQSRYLEYKQRVPQCFGAFISDPVLSKSIFIADREKDTTRVKIDEKVSPSYIRSNPLEFDPFYLSLTGLSLSDYYHFQIIHWNRVKSIRPMVFNPQLG